MTPRGASTTSQPWFEKSRALARDPIVLAAVAGVAALTLYSRTAAPGVLPGDAGEFQFAAWRLYLTHPTGYPLYLLLGSVFQHLLPFGDPAYRLNLFSAVWSALAVVLAYGVFWRVTRSRVASGAAALTLAVTPLVWSQATRAEVYGLNTFFLAALTLLALLWHENPRRGYAIGFAAVLGLSLAHHRMTLLWLPAFAILIVTRLISSGSSARTIAARAVVYAGLAALPLLLYLYIPLRAGATPYATLDLSPADSIVVFENSPRGWLDLALGRGFASDLSLDARTGPSILGILGRFVEQLTPLGTLGVLFGFGALVRQRRAALLAFVLAAGGAMILFGGAYHIGDIADYDAPLYFLGALLLAVTVCQLVAPVREWRARPAQGFGALVLIALFLALPFYILVTGWPGQDASARNATHDRWAELLARPIPEGAILISDDRDEMTPLYYFQYALNQRQDLVGLFPKISTDPRYGNVVDLAGAVAASGRPMYALKPIPALRLRYTVENAGNGLEQIRAVPLAAPAHPSGAILGDSVRVIGYSPPSAARAGEAVTVTVQYEPIRPLARDYTTSLQLFDAGGEKVGQADDHVPGAPDYPSSRWPVAQAIHDEFVLPLDAHLAPGPYRLMLRFYDPVGGNELGELTEFGTIEVSK